MFKPNHKSVQKHANLVLSVLGYLCLSSTLMASGFLENTGVVDSVVTEDERGYIWNSGLVQILEEAGVAVASPRSVDPKLRLHYYLAECDQLIAEGDVEATDLKIQEALLDLTGMRGLLERQARVAGMLSNDERANTYWASVVTHPGATVNNLADAAWSYLISNQLEFGEMILELGEKREAAHPRLLFLRQLYQFKKGAKNKVAILRREDIPSLVFRIMCRKSEIEALGGSWLYEELCRWVLRGGGLVAHGEEETAPVMMEDGTVLHFSAKMASRSSHSPHSSPKRLAEVVEGLGRITAYAQRGEWEAMLAEVTAIQKLGGSGLYLKLLEMKGFGRMGRPMKSREIATELIKSFPDQAYIYFEWGALLMNRGEYQEALGILEKCHSLGYSDEVLEAWLAACHIQLFQDSKAQEYIRKGLGFGRSSRFKKQIAYDEPYWAPVRKMALQSKL